MDPYREVEPEPVKAAPVKRRTWRVPWFLVIGGAALGAIAIAGAPLEVAAGAGGTIALVGGAARAIFRRRGAAHSLDGLPFPIEHNSEAAVDPMMNARRLNDVTVTLNAPLAGPELERAVERIGFKLSVKSEGRSLTLGGWPHMADHLALLSELLATWGKELHASQGIAKVSVNWAYDGPPLGI